MRKIIEPPKTFRKNGYDYQLIARNAPKNFALYAQNKNGGPMVAYEIHKLRLKPETEVNGTIFPPGPKLASNEEFGKYGWTYTSLQNIREHWPDYKDLTWIREKTAEEEQ